MAHQLTEDAIFAHRRGLKTLDVIIVGAGIGGLMMGICLARTGHNVRILEKRRCFTEIGAGIQLAPNATRILRRFGLLEEVTRQATALQSISSRRWENNEELSLTPLIPRIEEEFGAPLLVMHRADLHQILLRAAQKDGCEVLTDCQVTEVNFEFPPKVLVQRKDRANWDQAHLIIASDGMNSCVRKQMLTQAGIREDLVPTGQIAYRFVLNRELVKKDEEVRALMLHYQAVRLMGPGGHVMGYPLRNNTLYNVVLVSGGSDGGEPKTSSWTKAGNKQEMIKRYHDWCPLTLSLMAHAPESEVLETPMNNMAPLPTWAVGQVVLAGDACHQMLPYVAQGAANAIEDAATLAMTLTCTDDIPLALETYQRVRKSRSEKIQASATRTGDYLHLPDGEAQRKRDAAIRAASRGEGENPDQWNDREFNKFMWGVDVMAVTLTRMEPRPREGNDRMRDNFHRL